MYAHIENSNENLQRTYAQGHNLHLLVCVTQQGCYGTWAIITGWTECPLRRGWEKYTSDERVKNKLLVGKYGRLFKRDKKIELLRIHFLSFWTELLLTAGEHRLPPTLRFPPLPVYSLLRKQRLYPEKGTFLYFGYELLFLKLHPPNIFLILIYFITHKKM